MSIVRVGLAETGNFAEGYDAIFGKKRKDIAMATSKSTKKTAAKKTAKASANSKKKKTVKKKK